MHSIRHMLALIISIHSITTNVNAFQVTSSLRKHQYFSTSTQHYLTRIQSRSLKQKEIDPIIYPDYLITDSEDVPNSQRPSLFQALINPRDILGLSVVLIGTIVSLFNVLGLYDEKYLALEAWAISLGFLSSLAHIIQINTGYLISPNIRRGIVDDAAVNLYAGLYTAAVSWLALRTSQICPDVLKLEIMDKSFAALSILVFVYSLLAPVITLISNSGNKNDDGLSYKLSEIMVRSARGPIENKNGQNQDMMLPPLSQTELLRARGLLFIGVLGCIFTPDALSFFLGGQDWWGRVSTVHSSQQTLESSTSLFAIFATESSMISHRVGKLGVAKYSLIVPAFAGVCFVLAVIPCICALNWLGDDVSFFSFYRE